MAKLKYSRYIYKRLIKKSVHPEITAPIVSLKPKKETGGPDISFEWCYISQPVIMANRPAAEDLDRFLVWRWRPLNLDDFKAEIEISLGEKGMYISSMSPVVPIFQRAVHYP
jgi:hypothetical protein